MKRILLILLIIIYTTSSFGMVVKESYCCGKLTSVSLLFSTDSKGKQTDERGCCKTKTFDSKIKDNHLQSDAVTLTTKHFASTDSHLVSAFNIGSFSNPQLNVTSGINDPPPLYNNVPIYIFIRVIRI
jgi:hypothetical protein